MVTVKVSGERMGYLKHTLHPTMYNDHKHDRLIHLNAIPMARLLNQPDKGYMSNLKGKRMERITAILGT